MPLKALCFFALCLIALLSGCASTPPSANTDPLESVNRKIHSFNDTMDSWVLKPVATGYRYVTPNVVENGISNFFSNLAEVRNVFNDLLQWKWQQAGNDTGRLLVNSTLGIAGFVDVAKHFKLEKSDGEDFGQTLAVWGVGQGPYIVIPFLGPSTLRDGVGLPADWALDPITYLDDVSVRNSLTAFNFVVDRASLLDAEAFISGDRYVFFREAYLQRREFLINDGQVEDDFGDFDDEDF